MRNKGDELLILSDERYEQIKTTVVELFEKLDIHCTPISGFEIATQMGVKVIPYSAYPLTTKMLMLKRSEDGFSIKKTTGEWFIFYNDEKPYGRVNNTIMHEDAHIILDHTEDSELAESEAKFFAKFALAPPVLIHKFGLNNAFDISNRFEISYEAAKYALNFYHKWLNHGNSRYTNYEIKLCQLFGLAV